MSGWNQTGCCCEPGIIDNPCEECGRYGSACCLKIVGNDGVWFFRSRAFLTGTCDGTYVRAGCYNHDGDVCVNTTDRAWYLANNNLCGTLLCVRPCRIGTGWGSSHGDTSNQQPSLEPHYIPFIDKIWWQVRADCSSVLLQFDYVVPIAITTAYTHRYSMEVSTSWLDTDLPLTFTAPTTSPSGSTPPAGSFVLSACAEGESLLPTDVICCWQAEITTPTVSTVLQSADAAETYTCMTDDTAARFSLYPTDQCSRLVDTTRLTVRRGQAVGVKGVVMLEDGDTSEVPGAVAVLNYSLLGDYTTLRLSLGAYLSGRSPDWWAHTWSVTWDIPYTEDWYLTPIVVPSTGSFLAVSPFTANQPPIADVNLTLSVCGVTEPPIVEVPCGGSTDCFPDCISGTVDCDGVTPAHSLLFVDIDEAGETWDGYHNLQYSEDNNQYEMLFGGGGLTITITLGCSGTDVVLTVTIYSSDLNDTQTNSYTSTLSCTGGATPEINDISFTLQWPEAGIYAGATIFSNNNGLR